MPISTNFSGSKTVSQDISEIWIKPSAPSISTKIPNLDVPSTLPSTISPTVNSLILSDLSFFLTASSAALSENIALFLLLFSSVILNSISIPINPGFEGPDGEYNSLEGPISWERGTKPCIPSHSTTAPPLLLSTILPINVLPSSLAISRVFQPCSPFALSIESKIVPSEVSGKIT